MENELTNYQPTEKSVVIYRSKDGTIQLEVQLYNNTVWMNRQQLATLFERDVKTIGKHIKNALNEELKGFSVVANFATTASDGKTYQVEYYSLDMVLSVGYRVKSQRGIDYRHWANEALKDYLVKGYAINQRVAYLEQKVAEHDKRINFFVQTSLPPVQGVFCDGQIFDAYVFVSDLIKRAKSEIILIDNYVDETVLTMLDKRNDGVKATIFTANFSQQLKLDLQKHNSQYQPINIEKFNKSHDRFLIIDDDVYLVGASLKDLGKKMFGFTKMVIGKDKILSIL
ncbi:MAG: virulence RhuM family protein [Bacteroidales bacterium]|nr:virulence RhuM family protein [Bacteroidales bacterium]